MYRRHLILGIAILGTGCISIGNAPESATQTANTDSSPTPSASSTPISTSDVIIRSALRYAVATDSMTVEAPERAQFAFVRPPDDDSERPLDAYELVVGDRQFSPRSSVGGRIRGGSGLAVPGSQTNINQAYTADNRSGWLVFDVPNVDADTGALRRGESNFPLPSDVLPLFGATPDFVVQSVTVPDATSIVEDLTITIKVANEGGRDGVFLAVIQQPGLPHKINIPVQVGETRTKSVLLTYQEPTEESIKFVHAEGTRKYDVTIKSD